MAYTTPSTFVAGNVLTAAQMNAIQNNIRFFHGVPTASVNRNTAQSISNNTITAIQFNSEVWDSNTIWSSTASNKFFARTAGKYLATFSLQLTGSSAGTFRVAAIVKNATQYAETSTMMEHTIGSTAIAATVALSVTGIFSMTTSDYLTAQVFQDTGGALNTSTQMRRRPKFQM